MTDASEKKLEELERYIAQLQTISYVLRLCGIGLLALTIINLGGVIAGVFRHTSQYAVNDALQGSGLAMVIIIAIAVIFEQFRQRGEVIYGEVTDELHRSHNDDSFDRPRISFRIALKSFARAMELPLIPGRVAMLLYLLLNLMAVVPLILIYKSN